MYSNPKRREQMIRESHSTKNAAIVTQGICLFFRESYNHATLPPIYTIHGVIAAEAAWTLSIDIVPSRKQNVPSQLEMSLRVIFILIVIQGFYLTLGEMSRNVFDCDAIAEYIVDVDRQLRDCVVAVLNTNLCATNFTPNVNSTNDLVNYLIH